MKKTRYLVLLVLLVILSACRSVVAPEFDLDPVVKEIDSKDLKYRELKKESDLIVKVKILDQLDLANSTVEDKDDFHALRQFEIVNVLENNMDYDFEKSLLPVLKESSAVDVSNVYYTSNHRPLSYKDEVVLFLRQVNDNVFELVDGDHSVVNTKDIIANQNLEITINTLFEYFEGKVNGKSVPYSELTLVDQPKNVKFDRYTLQIQDFEIPVRIGKDSKLNKEYLLIGNVTFQLKDSILDSIK